MTSRARGAQAAGDRPPTEPSDQPQVTRRDVWIRMLLYPRHTLPTAAGPVGVGIGLAVRDGVFEPAAAACAFLAGWLIQLGGVFADNYHNLRRHPDDREHPLFVKALREGLVSMAELRDAVRVCYALAAVAGAYLVYVGSLPVLLLGLAAVVASLAYSSDPFPLGDRALGDTLFFLFFGIVSVVGTYYVQAASALSGPLGVGVPPGTVTLDSLLLGLPVGALITDILVIDNIRDLEFDRAKREITLAVLIGPFWSRVEYLALAAFAYIFPVALWVGGRFDAGVLLPLLSLPYAAVVAGRVARARTHEQMIPLTPQAGQVVLAHSVLLALGVAA